VYTETVKKMMKAKGIELPLSHAKLAELRKIAKATPGQYESDKDEKGGSSHAKGTMNVSGKKNKVTQQVAKQTQKVQIFLDRRTGRKKTRRPRTAVSLPTVQDGPQMFNPPAYNMIRPFVANTPMGFHPSPVKSEELVKAEKEKDLAAQLKRDEALQRRTDMLEALVRRSEEIERNSQRHIRDSLISSSSSASGSPPPPPPPPPPPAESEKEEEEEEVAAKPAVTPTKEDYLRLLDDIHEWPKGKGAQTAMEEHATQIMGINLRGIGTTFDKSKQRIEGQIRKKIEALAEAH
jgi:hypothetical protein